MIPELDRRKKEEIARQIERLAAAYTPQWRYNRRQPDMGSVLAELFAELMEESIGCYNRMPARCRLAFLDALGAEGFPPRPAEGYLVFSLAGGDMPETVAEAGTGVAAEGKDGGLVRFETLEETYVCAASVELVRKEEEGSWYVWFDRCPDRGAISLLFSMEQWRTSGDIHTEWEYLAPKGWNPLPVEDLTDGLSHAGLVRFVCMSQWRRETREGREGFWMRIRKDKKAPFPCGEARVFINAAPVRAQTLGKAGNLPPGGPYKLTKTVGYVAGAVNPDALAGGMEAEAPERTAARGSARIRHRFRAVTPGDFERLVYEVCPDALKVKCFAGYDGSGGRRAGYVTVVVLLEGFREGRRYFYRTREQVARYLEEHAEGLLGQAGKLSVTQPVPVRVHVQCELCVGSYREVTGIRRQADEALRRFLDPVDGNHDGNGWEMGDIPDYEQIKACLLGLSGVRYLEYLRIAYEMETEDGVCEVLWEQLGKYPWILPEMGECGITVAVWQREVDGHAFGGQ